MTQEELEFRRRCPYDAFGDYSDVLKKIRQKEKENKTDTVSVVNRSKGSINPKYQESNCDQRSLLSVFGLWVWKLSDV